MVFSASAPAGWWICAAVVFLDVSVLAHECNPGLLVCHWVRAGSPGARWLPFRECGMLG